MICNRCGEDKPQTDFYKRKVDTYYKHCKKCHLAYPRSEKDRKPYDKKWKEKQREYVRRDKMSKGCQICNEKRHPHCLDYHHLDPTTKEFAPGQKYKVGMDRLIQEINKCAVLCATCHRLVHAGVLHL